MTKPVHQGLLYHPWDFADLIPNPIDDSGPILT